MILNAYRFSTLGPGIVLEFQVTAADIEFARGKRFSHVSACISRTMGVECTIRASSDSQCLGHSYRATVTIDKFNTLSFHLPKVCREEIDRFLSGGDSKQFEFEVRLL